MNLYKKMQMLLSEFVVEKITIDNIESYQELFFCNEDYYILTDGRPASKKTCTETIEYSPSGLPKENVYNIGVSRDGKPVCALFGLYGYPEEQTFYIGLFLLNEEFKRKGIGTKVIKALFSSFSDTVIEKFRLSVQDNNISGLSFWKKMGFKVVNKTACDDFANLSMQYDLINSNTDLAYIFSKSPL